MFAINVLIYMKAEAGNELEQEPIGIIISRGSRQEAKPVVYAYVWGPAPESPAEPGDTRAV
jgi:hypothetical protein